MNNIDEQLRKIDTEEEINEKTQEYFDVATSTLDNNEEILKLDVTFDKETSMRETLKTKFVTFVSDKPILDICNDRDLCISALQQDINFCDEVQEEKKSLQKEILDIKELQTPPTFEYPDFKPRQKPVFNENKPNKKSPFRVYSPFMNFCSEAEGFHAFITFLFAVAFCFICFITMAYLSDFFDIFNIIDSIKDFLLEALCMLVYLAIVFVVPAGGVIGSVFAEGLREFLAKCFWAVVLFPVMLIDVIPVCLINISETKKYKKKVKNFDFFCKSIESDNAKQLADYKIKRNKEE